MKEVVDHGLCLPLALGRAQVEEFKVKDRNACWQAITEALHVAIDIRPYEDRLQLQVLSKKIREDEEVSDELIFKSVACFVVLAMEAR